MLLLFSCGTRGVETPIALAVDGLAHACTKWSYVALCRATEGHGAGGFGLTAAQAGAMGVPAAATGPVTSTSGATRIIVLTGCVTRDELLDDECASDPPFVLALPCMPVCPLSGVDYAPVTLMRVVSDMIQCRMNWTLASADASSVVHA